jgi:chromosome segregation ATPase
VFSGTSINQVTQKYVLIKATSGVKRVNEDSLELTCRQCGAQFEFTAGEQEFYKSKGFSYPSHCPRCRSIKQKQAQQLVCSQCENIIDKRSSVYCTSCLASVHLDFELNAKQNEKALNELQTKMQAIESQKSKLMESLKHKEYLVPDLQRKIDVCNKNIHNLEEVRSKLSLSESKNVELNDLIRNKDAMLVQIGSKASDLKQELEQMRELHVELDGLQPALQNMTDRLGNLENGQTMINQRMLQIVQRMHEMYEHTGLWEIIKRSLATVFFGQRTQKEKGR